MLMGGNVTKCVFIVDKALVLVKRTANPQACRNNTHHAHILMLRHTYSFHLVVLRRSDAHIKH